MSLSIEATRLEVSVARIYTWGSDAAPTPPSGQGVTDSDREEVRGCPDVLVGRLGV